MSYPYVGPPAHTSPGSNLPPTRIVIHGTVSPCRTGQARATATYFRSQRAGGSAHYVVDPAEVVQVARDSVICWHAPPNPHSIGVELCDPQAGSPDRWGDSEHEAMLVRAAGLVRDLTAEYDIPVVHLSPADLLAGKRGICGHVDVTNAWHQTTHTDPGPHFPWAHFLDLVNGDDMPTPRDLWGYDQDGKRRQAWSYLQTADANARAARIDAAKTLSIVEAMAAKPTGLSAAEIEAAAERGAKAALDAEIDSATVQLNVTQEAQP